MTAAFDAHERTKAPALNARLGATASSTPPRDVTQDLLEQEGRLRRVALSLQEEGVRGPRSERYRLDRLRELRADLREVESQIQASDPGYVRRRRGEPVGVPELCAALRKGAPVPTAAVSFFAGPETTTAFVLRSDRDDFRCYRIGVGRDALNAAATEISRQFNGALNEGYPEILRNKPWLRTLPHWESVSRRLVAFTHDLVGIEALVVAPHGPLHLLPLHAARTSDGRFLAEDFYVSYAPSLTILSHALSRRDDPASGDAEVYVAAVAARRDDHPERFERDDELFAAAGWLCTADLGPREASRDRVLGRISAAEVVHLTCHGEFSLGSPTRSGLLFSDGSQRPPGSLQALSMADRFRFLVSVGDLAGRSLRARLVTLRACSTGLHRRRNAGDEFEGLVRALLGGGAHAVLASLWNVDQRSSRELLSAFYRRWMAGRVGTGVAEALTGAQRELIASGDPVLSHPYHWAPFVLIGDWR